MAPFGAYARYYDLFYRNKDYAVEAAYVLDLIRRYAPQGRSLLELGCGTGIHACAFARAGYAVVGVDRSEEMLAEAGARTKGLLAGDPGSIQFAKADIRSFALSRKFDAVVALFHVMSYLPANDDLEATLACVREHLDPGGVFVFDFWYGPAVLTARPERRVKLVEDETVQIERTGTPTLHVNDNLVDVDYEIVVTEKASGRSERLNETHRMRYLFWPELQSALRRHRLRPIAFHEWLSEKTPDAASWNAVTAAMATA